MGHIRTSHQFLLYITLLYFTVQQSHYNIMTQVTELVTLTQTSPSTESSMAPRDSRDMDCLFSPREKLWEKGRGTNKWCPRVAGVCWLNASWWQKKKTFIEHY